MNLQPIAIDEDKTKEMYANAFCQDVFKSYPEFYYKTGYNPPWIGYFIVRDHQVVGVCGFVGEPRDGRVEIAYGTFKPFEGQGIASFSCQQLINIARSMEKDLLITAKTAPEKNASTSILSRAGFQFSGIVQDHEIGEAWEWLLLPPLQDLLSVAGSR